MNTLSVSLVRSVFGLSPQETSFERRGFRVGHPALRTHLERIGAAFISGYNAALEHTTASSLAAELDEMPPERRGFAFEGAAMALALLDVLTPWRRGRVQEFLRGPGDAHAYMVHVGVGWAWARLPVNPARAAEKLDPLLRWLAFDGYGFHEAFFKFPAYLAGKAPPRGISGPAARVFDQGFGRGLWFVEGGDVEAIPRTIAALPPRRHADLWSGVGLAATYAGGVSADELLVLRARAGAFAPQLAQGSAFAAKARQRAGNLIPYTDVATRALCGWPAPEAARLCDDTLENLPANASQPAFEIWRRRIQNQFQLQPQLQEA